MLKKLLLMTFVGLLVVFSNMQNKSEARDVFVGISPATNWDCYIMTETIIRGNKNYSATLKMVTGSGNIEYINYLFFLANSRSAVTFENSQGYSGYVSHDDTPIEWAMWKVITDYRS